MLGFRFITLYPGELPQESLTSPEIKISHQEQMRRSPNPIMIQDNILSISQLTTYTLSLMDITSTPTTSLGEAQKESE